MSGSAIADRIAPELPYLRRFARALCGTQESGDGYVVQTLEAIIADNQMYDESLSPRVALYKAFLKVWNALPLNTGTDRSVAGPTALAERRLEQITPVPRQAFLLTAVEEFSPREVAAILDRSSAEVLSLIDEASREISSHIAARVMIIEDEPLIALDIETLVSDIGHTSVGIAATRDQAIELASKTRPDIILSDIQLADGSSGIDAVADILKAISVPVIYITAYPERLLTGERREPAFLITKPFQPSMVKAMVSQALFFGVDAGKAA
ncbi:MAG TPA: response regulator [Hyphomicrobiaceae bacterium]|nr:response regulator [Hyphomicrobiaceae bacterium]